MSASYIAVFSCDASGTAIHVTPDDDPYSPVASAYPSRIDQPTVTLWSMGYLLAYPSQTYLFGNTMKEAGYQKVFVVPTSTRPPPTIRPHRR